MLKRTTAIAAGLLSTGLAASAAYAQEAILLENGQPQGVLVRTDSPSTPNVGYAMEIKGLEDDERLLSIGTALGLGHLYGITQKRLYEIDQNTGQATAVGPRFKSAAIPGYYVPDLEIDPVSGVGFVLGPNRTSAGTGIVATFATDTGRLTEIRDEDGHAPRFVYAPGDVAETTPTNICAIACAGDVAGAAARTMFGLDRVRRTLVRVGSVGGLSEATDDRSVVHTVAGITGLPDGADLIALDEDSAGGGWLGVQSYQVEIDRMVGIYRLDLTTGVATLHRDTGLTAGLLEDMVSTGSMYSLPPLVLDVKKAVVRYDFRSTHGGVGSITITGTVPYPTDGGRLTRVAVDVDGVVREFVTDSRGRARSGRDVFRFVGKLRAGRLRYELTIRRTDLQEVAGVAATTPTKSTQMTVDLFLEGRAYRTRLDLDYFAGRRRGTARTP